MPPNAAGPGKAPLGGGTAPAAGAAAAKAGRGEAGLVPAAGRGGSREQRRSPPAHATVRTGGSADATSAPDSSPCQERAGEQRAGAARQAEPRRRRLRKKLPAFPRALFNSLFHHVPHISRGFSFQADSPVTHYPCTSITPSCHQAAIHTTLFVGNRVPPLTPLSPTSFSNHQLISACRTQVRDLPVFEVHEIKTVTSKPQELPTPPQDARTRCRAPGARRGHCPGGGCRRRSGPCHRHTRTGTRSLGSCDYTALTPLNGNSRSSWASLSIRLAMCPLHAADVRGGQAGGGQAVLGHPPACETASRNHRHSRGQ